MFKYLKNLRSQWLGKHEQLHAGAYAEIPALNVDSNNETFGKLETRNHYVFCVQFRGCKLKCYTSCSLTRVKSVNLRY